MNDELISIGDLARGSGLTISAIRFYDAEGVLTPAWVDPASSYRRYRRSQVTEARIIAGLRRVGMSVADIARVVSARDVVAAQALLDHHLLRLELGLDDARRELSIIREVLHCRESPMNDNHAVQVTVDGAQLCAALAQVRFAAAADSEIASSDHAVLAGVLIEIDGQAGVCRVVATDRHRLAVSAAPLLAPATASAAIVAPAALVDRVLADAPTGAVTVTLGAEALAIGPEQSARLDGAFPDYRRITSRPHERRVPLDGPAFARALRGSAASPALIAVSGDQVGVVGEPADGVVAVDRGFLLEALGAHAAGPLVLELDGPIGPLAIRDPQRPQTFSLLMPIRL